MGRAGAGGKERRRSWASLAKRGGKEEDRPTRGMAVKHDEQRPHLQKQSRREGGRTGEACILQFNAPGTRDTFQGSRPAAAISSASPLLLISDPAAGAGRGQQIKHGPGGSPSPPPRNLAPVALSRRPERGSPLHIHRTRIGRSCWHGATWCRLPARVGLWHGVCRACRSDPAFLRSLGPAEAHVASPQADAAAETTLGLREGGTRLDGPGDPKDQTCLQIQELVRCGLCHGHNACGPCPSASLPRSLLFPHVVSRTRVGCARVPARGTQRAW